ncbi:MAG: type IV pilin protein [Gammaproteobacteria bacterium]
MKLKTNQGMTLIELLITLLVISIIATIASSLYSPYVRKGRRIDAVNAIISISLAEERYRSQQTQYGTLAQVWGGVTASSEGYYALSITNIGASSYTITAAAIGDQANDAVNGVSCASIVLSVNNGTVTKSPAACWPQ